jgi:hypothetical protein
MVWVHSGEKGMGRDLLPKLLLFCEHAGLRHGFHISKMVRNRDARSSPVAE